MSIAAELMQRVRQLEERLRTLEDDKAIRELLARYGFNADQGRSDDFVALFETDGALEVTLSKARAQGASIAEGDALASAGDVPGEDVVVRHEGHAALGAFIRDPKGHKAIEGMSLHLMGNNLVTRIDGDTATAESYNLTIVRRGAQFHVIGAAVNIWHLVKIDGAWRIKENRRRRPGTPGYQSILAE